ncbi:hypothetical protein SASPL_156029 [Salvia splendens]|uniref:Uncharacterized protein n=1 Tax=Salvia splendens TaxID=180675 RepID=A0A8X8VXK3_SALSN|nr:hypothetical protein SASPL_156029 [Salvia splendens]
MAKAKKFSWGSPGRRGGRLRRSPGHVLEAAGPDVPPHLHRRHLLQAQLPGPRRRGHTDRPRHQPNVAPIRYSDTVMSIPLRRRAPRLGSRGGRLAAAALVPAAAASGAAQRPPARPTCQELRGRRGAPGDAAGLHVDIAGTAKVLWWNHGFRVHVDSHVIVDPVYLDVIGQENKSKLELFVNS